MRRTETTERECSGIGRRETGVIVPMGNVVRLVVLWSFVIWSFQPLWRSGGRSVVAVSVETNEMDAREDGRAHCGRREGYGRRNRPKDRYRERETCGSIDVIRSDPMTTRPDTNHRTHVRLPDSPNLLPTPITRFSQ